MDEDDVDVCKLDKEDAGALVAGLDVIGDVLTLGIGMGVEVLGNEMKTVVCLFAQAFDVTYCILGLTERLIRIDVCCESVGLR